MYIASLGHSGSQISQLMHSLVIFKAIEEYLFENKSRLYQKILPTVTQKQHQGAQRGQSNRHFWQSL